MNDLRDEDGKSMPCERADRVKLVFQVLMNMNEHDRGLALCWFCKHCHRYMPPGDYCHCWNDE